MDPAGEAMVTSYDDLRAMQALTQWVWPSNPRWNLGELAWARSSPAADTRQQWRTRLWTEGDRCLAWGWLEPPGELSLLVDPAAPELVDEVLRWFDEAAEDGEQTCTPLETEHHVIGRLEAAGFVAWPEAPYFRYHSMPLDDLPELGLPAGFRLEHVAPGQAAERATVHRAGWSDFGSTMSAERYEVVMATWPYRPELDWVAVAPDGTWVASALGWLDPVNRCGVLEPVGCDPAYRRLGLARAVSLASLRAMRAAGAVTGLVNPRGDEGYPAPGRVYRSLGFEPGPRTTTYVKASTD